MEKEMASAVLSTPSMFQLEPSDDVHDKLTNEIFSILEKNFLFGYDHHRHNSNHNNIIDPKFSSTKQQHSFMISPAATGRVRILSIDAGGSTDGILAAKSLVHLEATLRRKSGKPNAHVSDFFDVVAGAGVGGVLAALLFTRGKDGNPMFSAEKALAFILQNGRKICRSSWAGLFRRDRRPSKALKKVFGDLTLRDTLKAVLIPCYDLTTCGPFLFSRADALEMDGCDFTMGDVCRATIADRAVEIKSVDGRTKIVAVGGGVVMNNPTAAAITHVLNNKHEFPLCKGVEDCLVISLGNGELSDSGTGNIMASPAAFVKIAGDGAADMVDQAVSMAFDQSRSSASSNTYVRIQGNGSVIIVNNKKKHHIEDKSKTSSSSSRNNNNDSINNVAEEMLSQRNVESLLFHGKKLGGTTNLGKLEAFACELIKEQESRKTTILPPVVLKQASSSSPRTSSATTLSTASSSY